MDALTLAWDGSVEITRVAPAGIRETRILQQHGPVRRDPWEAWEDAVPVDAAQLTTELQRRLGDARDALYDFPDYHNGFIWSRCGPVICRQGAIRK